MKFTAILLLAAVLQVSAKGTAQTVTYKARAASLKEVFAVFKQQTRYSIFYRNEDVQGLQPVSIELDRADITTALRQALRDQPLAFVIEGKTVVITVKPSAPRLSAIDTLITVTGKIVDPSGKPIAGANIMVRGTTRGTAADATGVFVLAGIADNASIVVSSIGYDSKEIRVSRAPISVILDKAVEDLEQTVVIAYGKTSKLLNTSNIGSVSSKDIERQPVSNPLLALQGRVPGLLITQGSGIPGASVTVRVQGQNSIQSGNDPLYVVDGVPIDPQLPQTGLDGGFYIGSPAANGSNQVAVGNPLSYLNPADIERIDVLKDADATAIYGSRAANGALLITTKKGQWGRARVDLNVQQGWGKVAHQVKMLNRREYLDMRYEAFANDGIDWTDPSVAAHDLKMWDTTRDVNWQNELIGQTAHFNQVNASVSGGSANVQYRLGGTYNRATTVFPVSSSFANQKAAVNMSMNLQSANQQLKLQFSSHYMFDNNHLPGEDFTSAALLTPPVAPPQLLENGDYNWALNPNGSPSLLNSLVNRERTYTNTTTNLISSLSIKYSIIRGLDIGSQFGYTALSTKDYNPVPLISIRPDWRNTVQQRNANFGDRSVRSFLIEPQASYNQTFGDFSVNALVGTTINQRTEESSVLNVRGQSSDELLEDPRSGNFWTVPVSQYARYKYAALFGRINLQYQDKYVLNISGRRDGSSRFGPANRFNNFGAVGAAWILSNEPFFHPSWISMAKLRASYGTIGNDQIGDYIYTSTYNALLGVDLPYQGVSPLTTQRLANTYIQWEETRKLQFGVDLSFFDNRAGLTVNYVRNHSSNQLISYILPSYVGMLDVIRNFGAKVANHNWEIAANVNVIRGQALSWSVNANLTVPENKLLSFPGLASSTYANTFVVGQPLNIVRTFRLTGVDPQTGVYQFADAKGDPVAMPAFPADYTALVNLSQRYYGGLQNSLSYKGFTLDFLLQFVSQRAPNFYYGGNTDVTPGSVFRSTGNQPASVLDRWQQPGDDRPIQQFSSYFGDFNTILARASDRGYDDASYVRLKTLSFGWNLRASALKKMSASACQVYVQGQNLLTITNYTGLDPETQSFSRVPPLRMLTIGIKAGF